MTDQRYTVSPIGWVRSPIVRRADAPKQADEGAPQAWLVLEPELAEGLRGLRVGAEVLVLTWFDRAARDVLIVHPRGDPAGLPTGVFGTRSPDRPNPVGVHHTEITAIEAGRIRVGHLEALDGTPIVDIKPVRTHLCER